MDEDYEGVIECITSVRGPSNYVGNIYDSSYLKRANEIAFFAAVAESGEIVGTIAAARDFFDRESLCLLSMLTVKKGFTGKGIASALFERIVAFAIGNNVPVMKGHAVTIHTILQNMMEKHGFMPTGILFGVKDNANCVPKESVDAQKQALVILARPVAKTNAGDLFIHEGIRDAARAVYGSLNASFTIAEQAGVTSGCAGVMNHFYDSHNSVFYIQVVDWGNNLRDEISRFQEKCGKSSLNTITLMLNISKPSAIRGYEALCDMGFVFSGFDPLGETYEHAVMFYGSADTTYDFKMSERLSGLMNGVLGID